MGAPLYPTSDVVRLAALAIVTGKARNEVTARLALTDPEAEAFAKRSLAALAEADFYQTIRVRGSPADIYALQDKHGSWWIKVVLEHGRLTVISCHEPEFGVTCKGGQRVPGKRRK
jgi:hypothetical protein